MINNLIDFLTNKKILILGLGKEGISTYKLIRKYLKEQPIYIGDYNEDIKNNELFKNDKNIIFKVGKNYLNNLNDYDLIIKTPGISFKDVDTLKIKDKITSELELFLEFFPVFTIGVTGTKGKSTTSSLIYQMLKEQGKKCLLLGNIGNPVFDYLDEIEENMFVVLEMSSHQLEFMHKSPNIAILLNIFEEHLDHYNSYREYALSKCNIYKHQKANDYFLYNIDNKMLQEVVHHPCSVTYQVSLNKDGDIYFKDNKVYFKDKILFDNQEKRNLLGTYNLNNIMFVLGVSEILNLNLSQSVKSICNFKTLEHRLELVGTYHNITFYNNSIATIPEATIEAIKALENVDTLIIGGMDRGIDFQPFIDYLNNCSIKNIICLPKTGHDIGKKLNKPGIMVETLEEAVKVAKEVTSPGKICLLSPASPSYGFFKSFEERGNLFKELVKRDTI